jgi:hypothetical protein
VYVEEQSHGSADDRGAKADGGRPESRGCGAGSGSLEAHAVRLEDEVRRDGRFQNPFVPGGQTPELKLLADRNGNGIALLTADADHHGNG